MGPVVYAIYVDQKLWYIGQTTYWTNRHWRHKKTLEGKKVAFKVSHSRQFGDWAMREIRLIAKLRPPGNARTEVWPFHRKNLHEKELEMVVVPDGRLLMRVFAEEAGLL